MSRETKVGLFVALGLLMVGISVFLIGDNRRLWDSQVTYQAAFGDVSGLKPGSPVRMGGVDIGTVTKVGQSKSDPNDPLVYVDLSIVKTMSSRVRVDTVAKVTNKGLLGDKMVELTVVDGSSPPLAPGGRIKSEEPADFTKYLSKIDTLSQKAEKAIDNIEKATRPLSDPKLAEDVKQTISSLREVLDGVAHQDSAAHRILMDPEEGVKVDRALSELAGAVGQLHAALADVRDVTHQVREGPGIAHALLYDGEMSKNASGMLAELHEDLRAVREGQGIGHAIIYGDEGTQRLMGNVVGMSDDLRHIVADVRAGKGTLGGFLVDPTIYEDVKALVGNLERNEVLRSLVRYSIKADERRPPKQASPAQ
jgi:phospholipid/cholesterol/gamma-HCH transport system substrate-binding protein